MELWIVWIIVALLAGSGVGFLLGKLFMQTKLAASETALAKQQEFAARQEQNCREQLAVQKKFFEDQLLSQKNLQKEAAQAQYEQLKAEFKVLAEKVLAEKSESFEKNNKLSQSLCTEFMQGKALNNQSGYRFSVLSELFWRCVFSELVCMLLSVLTPQAACPCFFSRADSLLLPQYLFMEMHAL